MRTAPLLLVGLALGSTTAHALPPVQIGVAFDGANATQSDSIPPDTMGATGAEHVVVMLNGRYSVFRKSDGALVDTQTLDAFWTDAGVATGLSFDPRIVYDAAAQRWFALSAEASDSPSSAVLVAVSKSADPTDGFTAFRIDADATDATWADFPMIGLDADALYVSTPAFPVNGPDFPTGNTYMVLPKDDLLAPAPTVANATIFPRVSLGEAGFQPSPVVNLDGGGLPAKFYSGTLTFLGQIQESHVDGPVDAPVFTGGGFIAAPALGEPPDAEQPGPKQNLDAGDSRFSANLVLQNGVAWAVQSVDVDGRAAVRWLQIDPENDIVLDSGVVADPDLDLTYPSIAVNELDQIVIGMSGSGEDQFPSAYAVAGEKVGGTTTFGDLLLLAAGAGDYEVTFSGTRNRWGDYSATVLDPTDPQSFWTFQEFALAEDVWGVRVTQLVLVPEPGTLALVALGVAVLARRRG
jgi:hypothetical protein